MERINFLDCQVDSLDMQDALNWMDGRIKERNPGAIAVVNANKYWRMSQDVRLRQFVQNAELVIPEWAVYWGAARVGTPVKAYVAGVALLQAAMPWAEKKGYRPYFLGAKPSVINALAARLKSDFPRLRPAGFHQGYLKTQTEHEIVLNKIAKSSPDLIFVAMGSPKQEYWIAENSKRLNIPVSMGVGGSFDVLAGIKKDTPCWARGNGLEWLYRLSLEPSVYWKRYLICNPWFVVQVLLSYLQTIPMRCK
jgi:N-acetylglucosaminyldiphosphoundecaprenol N-acetyl-beta-D-mannosaminyltransferase